MRPLTDEERRDFAILDELRNLERLGLVTSFYSEETQEMMWSLTERGNALAEEFLGGDK